MVYPVLVLGAQMKIFNALSIVSLLAGIVGCSSLDQRSIYDNSGLSSGTSMGILEKDAPQCVHSWANRNNYYLDVDNACLATKYPTCSGIGYSMDMKCIIGFAEPRQKAIERNAQEEKNRKEQHLKEIAKKIKDNELLYQNSPEGIYAIKEASILADKSRSACSYFLIDMEKKTNFKAVNIILAKFISEQLGIVICIYQGEILGVHGNIFTQIELTGNTKNNSYQYR